MSPKTKTFKQADALEIQSRQREIQLLFNIIEPDPEYQPFLTSDEATILDSTGHEKDLILSRLEFYFKIECADLLNLPIWQVVDRLKERLPGWPEEWESLEH